MAAESSKAAQTAPEGQCHKGIFQAKRDDLIEGNKKRGLAIVGRNDVELRLDRCMYDMELQHHRRLLAREKLTPLIKQPKPQFVEYLKLLSSGEEFNAEVERLEDQAFKPPVLTKILQLFKKASTPDFEGFPVHGQSAAKEGGAGPKTGHSSGDGERLQDAEKHVAIRELLTVAGVELGDSAATGEADRTWAALDRQNKVNCILLSSGRLPRPDKGKGRAASPDSRSEGGVGAPDPEEMVEQARRALESLASQAPRPGAGTTGSEHLALVSQYLDAAEEQRLSVSHHADSLVVYAARRCRMSHLALLVEKGRDEGRDEGIEALRAAEEAREALRDIAQDLGERIIDALGVYADGVLSLRGAK
ncbi:hypothetical protein LQW54_006364 [Pestalotiopsis sp. IQ-011]